MIGFYIALPFLYFISILPFPLLYILSDILFLLVFHVAGYRRKVVEQNLRNAFPQKSEKEILELSKKYFHYMCDLILESFKKITLDEKGTLKHCYFKDTKILDDLYKKNKSIILLMGHQGNWELAGSSFSLSNKHQLHVIYKPLSNPYFEKFMCKTRTMFGTKIIKMDNTLRDMLQNKNTLSAYAFIADQTPPPQNAYWKTFLNQDTPLFVGAEKLARKLNYPVVFINIVRKKRGVYEIVAELLSEEPNKTKEFEITNNYIERLEQEIIKLPETWLWSHRRWKHTRVPTEVLTTQTI